MGQNLSNLMRMYNYGHMVFGEPDTMAVDAMAVDAMAVDAMAAISQKVDTMAAVSYHIINTYLYVHNIY